MKSVDQFQDKASHWLNFKLLKRILEIEMTRI